MKSIVEVKIQQFASDITNMDLHNLGMDSRGYDYINEMPNSATLYYYVQIEVRVYIYIYKRNKKTFQTINQITEQPSR